MVTRGGGEETDVWIHLITGHGGPSDFSGQPSERELQVASVKESGEVRISRSTLQFLRAVWQYEVGVCCACTIDARWRDGRKASTPAPFRRTPCRHTERGRAKGRKKRKDAHPLKSAKGISQGVIYGCTEKEHYRNNCWLFILGKYV